MLFPTTQKSQDYHKISQNITTYHPNNGQIFVAKMVNLFDSIFGFAFLYVVKYGLCNFKITRFKLYY